MLEELYSDTGLLNKNVEFRSGINIILGKYSNKKQESGINGIGKSSLIRLIDYALLSVGADKMFAHGKYAFLRDENHTLTLKLKISGESYYIRRSFGKMKGIVGFGKSQNQIVDYEFQEIRSILLNKMFPITEEAIRYEGERFGTLLNFFIKDDLDQRQREDPLDFFPYRASVQEKFAYNFFLLGLPNRAQFRYGAYIKIYKEKSQFVKVLKEEILKSTGKKVEEFKSERAILEQRVSLLEKSLRDYKFLEKYKDIEKGLSELNGQIAERLKAFHSLSRKLKRLRELNVSDGNIDISEVNAMYAELSITFAGLVSKKLEEIVEFKKSLVENRIRYNLERERHFDASIRQVEAEISALEDKRATLFHQLEEKGELDSITLTYEELAAEKSILEKNAQRLRQLDETSESMHTMDIQIDEEKVAIYRDIKESETKLNDLRMLFQEIINSALFLSEEQKGSAYFDVSTTTNRKRDQLPFNIKIEVPKSDALGRFNLKLVAYDLLVFLHAIRTQRQLPRFLVHDGVFHGISRRTMIDTLNFIQLQSQLYPGFQYICTFNEDEIYIPEERKDLDGTLTFDLDSAVVARYTDSESGMIFKKAFG